MATNILHRIGTALTLLRTGINLIGTDAAKLDAFIEEIVAEAEAVNDTDPDAAKGVISQMVDEAVSDRMAEVNIAINTAVNLALETLDTRIATAVADAVAKLPPPVSAGTQGRED